MEIGRYCADSLNITVWSDIKDCAKGKEGRALHAVAGYQTKLAERQLFFVTGSTSVLTFVPTIALNGGYGNYERGNGTSRFLNQLRDTVKQLYDEMDSN